MEKTRNRPRRIFSAGKSKCLRNDLWTKLRLGSSGDVIRKSPGEIDSTNEDDSSPHKRRRSSVNVIIPKIGFLFLVKTVLKF